MATAILHRNLVGAQDTIRAANYSPDVVSYTAAIHACRQGLCGPELPGVFDPRDPGQIHTGVILGLYTGYVGLYWGYKLRII